MWRFGGARRMRGLRRMMVLVAMVLVLPILMLRVLALLAFVLVGHL